MLETETFWPSEIEVGGGILPLISPVATPLFNNRVFCVTVNQYILTRILTPILQKLNSSQNVQT